jgi:hypothetical protein
MNVQRWIHFLLILPLLVSAVGLTPVQAAGLKLQGFFAYSNTPDEDILNTPVVRTLCS